jgi:hypothetical protein
MDARDRAAMYGGNKTPVFIDDNDCEHTLPTKFKVCPLCEGKGTHINPSIDSHGLTAEDFYEDPGFLEDYASGKYNQTCNECHGLRVIEVVDEEACERQLLKDYLKQQEEIQDDKRMRESERRWGA